MDSATTSNCFISSFETVTEIDIYLKQMDTIFASFPNNFKLFDLFVYLPTKVMNNFATAYQYCNGYIYLA